MTFLVGVAIAVGLVGVLVPVLPGAFLVLGAIAVWAFAETTATAWSVLGVAVVTIGVSQVVKYVVPGRRLRQAGIPNTSLVVGGLVGIVGFFVVPVVGLFLGQRVAAVRAVVGGAAEELAAVRALAADAGLADEDLAAHVVEAHLELVQLGVDARQTGELGLAQAGGGRRPRRRAPCDAARRRTRRGRAAAVRGRRAGTRRGGAAFRAGRSAGRGRELVGVQARREGRRPARPGAAIDRRRAPKGGGANGLRRWPSGGAYGLAGS